jgi:DNA-binding CsgD family transcriptional regulator
MGRSQRLRQADLRDAFRLLGEVREIGRDPDAWRHHMRAGLCELVGATVGISVEAYQSSEFGPPSIASVIDGGWVGEQQRRVYLRYVAEGDTLHDRGFLDALRRRGELRAAYTMLRDPDATGDHRLPLRAMAVRREQLIGDRDWYRSGFVQTQHRASETDSWICSMQPLPDKGGFDQITVLRPWRAKPFGNRELRLVALFHEELSRIWHKQKAREAQDPATALTKALPPRLRQVLECLCGGDAEKEVARKLGLSRETVHAYVKLLYTRLGVSSRGELLASYLKVYDFTPRLRSTAARGDGVGGG